MAFKCMELLYDAGVLLQDQDAVRWPLFERFRWANAAMRVIAVHKPTATAMTVQMGLEQGTLQFLPDGFHMLLDAQRNLNTLQSSPQGRSGGTAIHPMSRDEIDGLIPNWSDPSVLPFDREAFYVIDDTNDPRQFYVVPGNTGEGVIEIVASAIAVTMPLDAAPEVQNDLCTYDFDVPLRDEYRQPMLDFILSKCYLKEVNVAGLAAKAQAHYTLFGEAIGISVKVEATRNVNAPRERPAV